MNNSRDNLISVDFYHFRIKKLVYRLHLRHSQSLYGIALINSEITRPVENYISLTLVIDERLMDLTCNSFREDPSFSVEAFFSATCPGKITAGWLKLDASFLPIIQPTCKRATNFLETSHEKNSFCCGFRNTTTSCMVLLIV